MTSIHFTLRYSSYLAIKIPCTLEMTKRKRKNQEKSEKVKRKYEMMMMMTPNEHFMGSLCLRTSGFHTHKHGGCQ